MTKKIRAMRKESPAAAEPDSIATGPAPRGATSGLVESKRRGACPQCAVLLPEMERLRLDVKRLKEELSDARKQSGALKPIPADYASVLATAYGPRHREIRSVGMREAPSNKERVCAGPGKCGRLGCGHPGYGR